VVQLKLEASGACVWVDKVDLGGLSFKRRHYGDHENFGAAPATPFWPRQPSLCPQMPDIRALLFSLWNCLSLSLLFHVTPK